MRLGSLFSGAGLMDLGLERAGMTPVFQVEIDPYARRVLERHWPGLYRLANVRDAGSHNLPPCDVLAGGFPCTNISPAGDGTGLAGAESSLWAEFARLIRELQPRYVLVENSSALTARGLETILGDLAACRYDAEWDCLPAGAFGAPYLRARCFVVAYPAGDGWRAGGPGGLAGGAEGPPAARLQPTPRVLSGPIQPSTWWAREPGLARLAYGPRPRAHESRLRAAGHGVAVPVAEWLGRCLMAFEAERRTCSR